MKTSSDRGRLMRIADNLLSQVLLKERGPLCEIHKKICDRVGNMHVLSKAASPRLRYCEKNIIRAGWFCSHYWTHHDSDNPKAVYAKKRIVEILGEDYKQKLREQERYMSKHDEMYLRAKIHEYTIRLAK